MRRKDDLSGPTVLSLGGPAQAQWPPGPPPLALKEGLPPLTRRPRSLLRRTRRKKNLRLRMSLLSQWSMSTIDIRWILRLLLHVYLLRDLPSKIEFLCILSEPEIGVQQTQARDIRPQPDHDGAGEGQLPAGLQGAGVHHGRVALSASKKIWKSIEIYLFQVIIY